MGITADSKVALPGKTLSSALTADNTALVVADNTVINLTSDSTTATARTFTLSVPEYNGQELTLLFLSGSSNTAELAASSTLKLNGTLSWKPLQYDSLSLVGYGGIWQEVARSDNRTKTVVAAIVGDAQAVAVGDATLVEVTSDSTTASSRTFTLSTPAYDGQTVRLVFTSGSSNSAELVAAASLKLKDTLSWFPLQYDSLTLVGYNSIWQETCRSENRTKVVTAVLSADDQAVAVGDGTTVDLSSDNTTAANRTFTLSNPVSSGQQVTLVFTSAGSTTAQLADSGNVRLSAAWEPLIADTLTLKALGAVWYEVARADN